MNHPKKTKLITFILAAGLTGVTFFTQMRTSAQMPIHTKSTYDDIVRLASHKGIQSNAIKSALNAYIWAKSNNKLGPNTHTLTLIDFTQPSANRRMWVIDLNEKKVKLSIRTSQGKNSGLYYATSFSNDPGSHKSSLGLYVTDGIYSGKHGESMRLTGLESGINQKAESRGIVIHTAWYMTKDYVEHNNRAGRSFGCFAIAPKYRDALYRLIQGGSALFAYSEEEKQDKIIQSGPYVVS